MKKLALICSIVISVTLLAGCVNKNNENVVNENSKQKVEDNQNIDLRNEKDNSEEINKKDEEKKLEKKDIKNNDNKAIEKNSEGENITTQDKKQEDNKITMFKIYYYDVIEDKILEEDKKIENGEKITEDLILKELQSKNLIKNTVKINKIEKRDNVAIIDFNNDFINTDLGSAVESKNLECIAKTFLNALNLDKLKITVEGKSYSSGHIILEDNHYFTK
ncbi:MAG: GerMN domain-containing protein [Sarcina sp.]